MSDIKEVDIMEFRVCVPYPMIKDAICIQLVGCSRSQGNTVTIVLWLTYQGHKVGECKSHVKERLDLITPTHKMYLEAFNFCCFSSNWCSPDLLLT
jgi:hypothetical protein